MEEQIKELKEKVTRLEEKVGKYESWFKALAIVAVIFGIATPSWGFYLYQKAVDLTNKYGEVTSKYGEIKKQADGLEKDLPEKAEVALRSQAPKVINEKLADYATISHVKEKYAEKTHSHPSSPLPANVIRSGDPVYLKFANTGFYIGALNGDGPVNTGNPGTRRTYKGNHEKFTIEK